VKEIMQCMVELNSYPSVNVQNTTSTMLDYLHTLLDEAEKRELRLYPLGLYPGNVKTKIFPTPHYKFMQKMLGKEEVAMGTYATGFHFHYTLPRGVFDKKKRFLKDLVKSKVAKTMIDSYNFGIAADPALTALMQSSPIHNGKFVAKDTRLLLWRPGKDLDFTGSFHKQPKFAGLPIYKSTLTDLTYMLKRRQQKLHEVFGKHGYDQKLVRYTWKIIAIQLARTPHEPYRHDGIAHDRYEPPKICCGGSRDAEVHLQEDSARLLACDGERRW
jgi:gamma-glutamylcysteine synthetase